MSTPPAGRGVADLLRPSDPEARRRTLAEAGLDDLDGLQWVLEQAHQLVHGDPLAAEALAHCCEAAAVDLPFGDHGLIPRSTYLRARIRAERGDLAGAIVLIEESREGWLAAGRRLDALRTELGRMQVLDDLGRHADAVEAGERLLDDLRDLPGDGVGGPGDADLVRWLRAAALENLGVAYGFTGAHQRALDAYLHAEQVYASLGLSDEVARPRANRAVELVAQGHAGEGLRLLRDAGRIFADGDEMWFAKCLGHQGDALQLLGRYPEALAALEQARDRLERLDARPEASRLHLTIAKVYLALGLADDATGTAIDAARVFEAAGMRHDLAEAWRLAGLGRMHGGCPDEAEQLLARAAGVFEQVGDRPGAAEARLSQAVALAALDRTAEAAALIGPVVVELSEGAWPIQLALGLMQLADVSPPALATQHLDRAAVLVDELGLPHLRTPLLIRRARLARARGDRTAARALYTSAIEVVEGLRRRLTVESLRAGFLTDKLAPFDELVALLLEEPADPAAALAIGERARACTLYEVMSGRRRAVAPADRAVAEPTDLADLHDDLTAVYNELLDIERAGEARRTALRGRARELERSISRARLRRASTPTGSGDALTRGAPASPAAPGDAVEPGPDRAAAPAGTVALVYQRVGDSLAVFVIDGATVDHRVVDGAWSDVVAAIRELDSQWGRFQVGRRFVDRHRSALLRTCTAALAELYALLLGPVEDLLPPVFDAGRTLVVIPTGAIDRVPFHALHDGRSSLIERCPVQIAPSLAIARSLVVPAPRLNPALGSAVVIGVTAPGIPQVGDEARSVADRIPGSHLLLDGSATRVALETFAERGPVALLHVAGHGLHRRENPVFSSIRLGDGWMSAADVSRLDLHGAVVVLSACESGRQQTDGGEPVGMSAAFLAAGATAVVVSLWVVQDDVTAELMRQLYDRLMAGDDLAAALRRSQRAIAVAHPHPYHWAPFVLVGPFDRDRFGRST